MKNLLFLFSLVLFACQQTITTTNTDTADTLAADKHSLAEPGKAIVKHLDLDLKVDFNTRILTGKAIWTIENVAKADEIIFDTRALDIQKITLGDDSTQANFSLGEEVKFLGKSLNVKIDSNTTKVSIWYTTSKDAAALQWLNPQQTAGKKHPFLFTQSQAILARTWIPCQDSPGIRFTYNAAVTVPKELLALMSAQNPQQKSADGKYYFKQPYAIPSYLMALAVGDLQFKAIDQRTGIYAEPVTIGKAAWEFADMGKMVNAAEKLYGNYKWGRYDVLVLPPSFPFGGMENPMLTFATPTVIAGDRSLVSLIAHELAHSWSGNYVTNATWNDFWLNEGFTTYFERRIIEAVYGKEEAKMQEYLGFQALQETIKEIGKTSDDTRLKVNFNDRDPDEGVTDVAYEKGYLFLRTIEETVGRAKLDSFLNKYFEKHAFQSVTTEQFLEELKSGLLNSDSTLFEKIQLDAWVYKPGIPSNLPAVSSEKFSTIDSLIAGFSNGLKVAGLSQRIKTANELQYFLSALPDSLTATDMALLDKEFGFTKSGNSEVQASWYTLAIRHQYKPAYPNIEKFLTEVGRRKFLMPLYKEMAKTPEGKTWAKKVYAKARPNYHSVAYHSIDEVLR
ncbi:M1 family metallopeptidase [Paradesertivirga mongoliensis]|uniref:Aminopeptidase N n=1 Tax=Paradesertivirga mongoliensis TaxID=2100740 RepID=A0ABW4ZIB1_9SPHI|nr:M1 family metallopeptidase [Pedobacter mongoliensis]